MELRELGEKDKDAFLLGLKKWADEHTQYAFEYTDGVSYEQMLERLRKNAQGIELQEGYVPSSMLYGFVDGAIVGRVSIRHNLNAALSKHGGHIGYAVAPCFRGRGYATEMFRQAIEFCKSRLGLSKVLLTCADDNVPSYKIIEKFGGVLESKFYDEKEARTTRRYVLAL